MFNGNKLVVCRPEQKKLFMSGKNPLEDFGIFAEMGLLKVPRYDLYIRPKKCKKCGCDYEAGNTDQELVMLRQLYMNCLGDVTLCEKCDVQ